MNKKLLLIGGGGHCKSVLDSLLPINQYSEIGIIDKKENIAKTILGVSIIGSDNDLLKLHKNGYYYAFITVGSVNVPKLRIELFKMIEDIGYEIPNIVDLTANISESVKIEKGVFVGKNVVINVGSSIGKGVIINTASIIEHDCIIGQFSHVAPGAVLCGEVQVGANTHIGAKCVIKQQVKIGSNTVIGMGSVVLHDVGDHLLAYGNPCKVVQDQ
jgi:sugar O-acyltransferase (sialic acid O-acetyltransferase NeuD family)